MPYRLSCADLHPPVRLDQSAWVRTQLPAQAGDCHTDCLALGEGLSLVYAHYRPARDLLQTSNVERRRSLTITIALEGQSSTLGLDGGRFDFVGGHSTITAFSHVRGQRRFPAHQTIRQLRLVAEESLLHRYGLDSLLAGIRHDDLAHLVHFGRQSGLTQHLAVSLEHLHAQRGTLLDMQIAALGLLAEQTRALLPAAAAPATAALSAADQEKILHARDLLAVHYDRALTLDYLCAAVGTNAFKLKQGFRQLLGTSPHRLLTRIRMEKARGLLESGLRVSTVAYRVGYRHPSSFSAAFEKHYGRPPRSVAKNARISGN